MITTESFYRYSLLLATLVVSMIIWFDPDLTKYVNPISIQNSEGYIPYQETAAYSSYNPNAASSFNVMYPGYINRYTAGAIADSYRNCPWSGVGCTNKKKNNAL